MTAKSVMASAKRLMRGAPLLLEQQQDGGDQRAGVADTDPPDEVDDVEGPADRDVVAPDADALGQRVGRGRSTSRPSSAEGDGEAGPPALAGASPDVVEQAVVEGRDRCACPAMRGRGSSGSLAGECTGAAAHVSQLRVRVADAGQVGGARAGAQLVQQVVARARRCALGHAASSGSLSEPKTMAPVGQACWQAVCSSPSRMVAPLDAGCRCARARCAARSRCTSPSRRGCAP